MEKKLFKIALEFIKKYEIVAYVINIEPNHGRILKPMIKLQGHAFENYKAMIELDVTNVKEQRWYTVIENGVDLTLTYD